MTFDQAVKLKVGDKVKDVCTGNRGLVVEPLDQLTFVVGVRWLHAPDYPVGISYVDLEVVE